MEIWLLVFEKPFNSLRHIQYINIIILHKLKMSCVTIPKISVRILICKSSAGVLFVSDAILHKTQCCVLSWCCTSSAAQTAVHLFIPSLLNLENRCVLLTWTRLLSWMHPNSTLHFIGALKDTHTECEVDKMNVSQAVWATHGPIKTFWH